MNEVNEAIILADAAAKDAKVRALDPTVIDTSARTAMQDAEFLSQRLDAALGPLQERYAEVLAEEIVTRWRARRDVTEAKVAATAEKLAMTYKQYTEALAA